MNSEEPPVSELQEFIATVRRAANWSSLRVWDGLPADAPTVDLPPGSTPQDLCEAAISMGSDIIHVFIDSEDADATIAVAGFAKQGMLYRIVRQRPVADVAKATLPAEIVELLADDADELDPDEIAALRESRPATRRKLAARLDRIVTALLAHPDYDPYEPQIETQLLVEHCRDLTDSDFTRVKEAAQERFFDTIDPQVRTAAARLAGTLLKDPDYDPLGEPSATAAWVAARSPQTLGRVVRRTASELLQLAISTGLWERRQQERVAEARAILGSLTPALRDRLGFTTRNALRAGLLSEPLAAFPEARHASLVYWVCRLEAETGHLREHRYATAAAILMQDHGETRAATGRILGLSGSIIERITRTYPERMDIGGDPVLSALDPRLAAR